MLDDTRRTILTAVAPATAIFIFGVIYGSVAKPLLGTTATILSSLLIFSGSVQFTLAALVTAGAGTPALIVGAMTLNVRNLVLGAVLRPRVKRGPLKRGALAWFLTDEAAGLAIASKGDAGTILVVSGVMFYSAWQGGTILGVLGASLESLQDAAAAVFPVLFIGLAALACPSWSVAVRAVVAATVAALASWLWPGSQGIVAIVAAILVAIPGVER